jgi:hypothetical protein
MSNRRNIVARNDGKSRGKGSRETAAPPFAMPAKGAIIAAACALIAIAALAAYSNSFSCELFYDNKALIPDNEIFQQDGQAGRIFSSNYWWPKETDLYRPFTIYTYYLNYRLWGWGANPLGYHVFNLVLHILNGLLVFVLVSRISGRALIGAFSALLFVTHPVATEAVTNVVGRADLLAMFFVLSAFLLHISGSARPSNRRWLFYPASALCLAGGLLSKENAVAVVAVFILFDIFLLWPKVREDRVGGLGRWLLKRLGNCYAFYLVVIVGWLALRYAVLRGHVAEETPFVVNPLAYAPFLQREATAIVMLGVYLWRLVWPVTLSADYSYNQVPLVVSPGEFAFIASLAAILAAVVAGVLLWKKSPLIAFFISFFFVCIAPVCNVFLLIGTIGAERLLYMPSLAWCAGIAAGMTWLCGKLKSRRTEAVSVILLGLTVLYGYRTYLRNWDWRNEKAFWRATAVASPGSATAVGEYARVLFPDDPWKSLQLFERALGSTDENAENNVNYSTACMKLGQQLQRTDPARAREIYIKACTRLRKYVDFDSEYQREFKRRLVAKGLKSSDFVIPAAVPAYTNLALLADLLASTYPSTDADYLTYERAALQQVKQLILLQYALPLGHELMARFAMNIAKAPWTQESERNTFRELAAVSCMRAIILAPQDADAWTLLGECYSAMKPGLEKLIKPAGLSGGFVFVKDENGDNIKYLSRGAKSLIMLAIAAGHVKEAQEIADNVASRFDLPATDMKALLSEAFSREDERIWVGE